MSEDESHKLSEDRPALQAGERIESFAAHESNFPIIGIGASAGGLAAIEAFFSAMPQDSDSGMAFVVVQHLDPHHKSILTDLVKRFTTMRVSIVEDGMEVLPNNVYIIPPNRDMAYFNGKLHLLEPSAPRGLRLPIDFFFRSLAQDQHERAICIVLSGTGSDGALGLQAIKGEGGMAMVQSPESAAYDGMPRSAIATGMVDFVLPPDAMPRQLLAFVQHAFGRRTRHEDAAANPTGDLEKLFILIRAQTGHDLSLYKPTSILRRVERRMALAQVDALDDYVRYLRESPSEVDSLFQDVLIGVTSFFRDPDAFAELGEKVIPQLFAGDSATTRRLWVLGCSTGEEAYSLAILAREYLEKTGKNGLRVQIFATDINTDSIERARAGVYPESIAADVSPERLARYFVQGDSTYRISKSIRDSIVFSTHNMLKDPPFSHVDLISCRNLLIYMAAEGQGRLLPLFHYALNENGYLFLGNSETIGESTDLFATVSKKSRIYRRIGGVTKGTGTSPYLPPALTFALPKVAARDLAEQALLDTYVPVGVLIDANLDVLYSHGRTGKYLEPAIGEPSHNLLRMARPGLRIELAAAIREATAKQAPVRYDRLTVQSDKEPFQITLIVKPIISPPPERSLLLVVFEDVPPTIIQPDQEADSRADGSSERHDQLGQRVAMLEQELAAKDEYVKTMVEELETANEELRSMNEELQSANEEMESTNEELETSKEELQSVNEELTTVNTELQQKLDELSQVNNDIANLMASTNIGVVFVDEELRLQRFTPAVTRIIRLISSDLGRPLGDIATHMANYNTLVHDTQQVLASLAAFEVEVLSQEGLWFQLRIQPYRTLDNEIEGAVLTFVDITEKKALHLAKSEDEERHADGCRR